MILFLVPGHAKAHGMSLALQTHCVREIQERIKRSHQQPVHRAVHLSGSRTTSPGVVPSYLWNIQIDRCGIVREQRGVVEITAAKVIDNGGRKRPIKAKRRSVVLSRVASARFRPCRSWK